MRVATKTTRTNQTMTMAVWRRRVDRWLRDRQPWCSLPVDPLAAGHRTGQQPVRHREPTAAQLGPAGFTSSGQFRRPPVPADRWRVPRAPDNVPRPRRAAFRAWAGVRGMVLSPTDYTENTGGFRDRYICVIRVIRGAGTVLSHGLHGQHGWVSIDNIGVIRVPRSASSVALGQRHERQPVVRIHRDHQLINPASAHIDAAFGKFRR